MIHENVSSVVQARTVSRCVKGIAHEVRLAILFTLREGEKSVNELVEILGKSQPTVSHHLGLMRDRGLLDIRKAGTSTFYRLASDKVSNLIDQINDVFCHDGV